MEIKSSEHEFQYQKLVDHGHADKAKKLLEQDYAIDVKKSADFHVPADALSTRWLECKIQVMDHTCCNKFQHCAHARDILLQSKSELAECTSNMEWGTGLDIRHMTETIPDFWPGKNLLGQVLKRICSDLLEDMHLSQLDGRVEKCKPASPLSSISKKQAVV